MDSAIEASVVTGSFTLGAVLLTYLGSGLRQRQQRKHDDRAAYDQQIAEVIAAADDLRQRVQLFRTTWALGSQEGVAVGVNVGTAARQLLPESVRSKFPYFVAAAAMTVASELAIDGIIGKLVTRAGAMYLQAVTPAVERLISATASLRISPDVDLADAARHLSSAAITYADDAKSGSRRVKRADRAFGVAVDEFISVAKRRNGRSSSSSG